MADTTDIDTKTEAFAALKTKDKLRLFIDGISEKLTMAQEPDQNGGNDTNAERKLTRLP